MKFLSLDDACAALQRGELVLFPTETFYALGCDAMNPDAVGAVFSAKRRGLSLPVPIIIGSVDCLPRLAARVPAPARELMDAFWPGPLSIVLPALPEVPYLVSVNTGRVAVRFSPHKAAIDLCLGSDKVLVATSANISGEPPAASPEELDASLLACAAGVHMSGTKPEGRLPSTVVDVVSVRGRELIRILRPGALSAELIAAAGFPVAPPEEGIDSDSKSKSKQF